MSAKDVLDAIDRVLPASFKYGAFITLLSGVVFFSLKWGVVSEKAIFGQIRDIAGIGVAIGVALMLLAVFLWLLSLPAKIGALVATYYKARRKRAELVENLSFLPTDSKALLLLALRSPSGRFPSPGEVNAMRVLYDLKLVESEDEELTFYPYGQGRMMRVAKPIYAERGRLIGDFTKELSTRTGVDFNDDQAAFRYLEQVLQPR